MTNRIYLIKKDAYIHFYNNERIQLKTKLTPHEMRCQYVV
ncbi:MAG: IS3 family transposase [Clostridia bacterium]|nr:IS3 family transposase [Clostridia bacterium]